jgi:hypothetical protein
MTGDHYRKPGGLLLLLLAFIGLSPAAARQASAGQSDVAAQAGTEAAAEAEVAAFAAWLNRANAIQLRSQAQIMGLGPAVQQINASGAPAAERVRRIRAILQQALTAIEAMRAEFEALDAPDFPGIDLPPELRPAALKRQMLQLNRDHRSLIAELLRAVEAGAANPGAFPTAVQGLFRSIAAIYDSQILFARATMESAPRDSAERAIYSFEVAYLRGMYRVFRAYSPFNPVVDRALPADLIALADEVDTQIRDGEAHLAAELAAMERELAGEAAQARRAPLLRHAIATMSISRDYFPVARRLAAHFRELAQSLRGQALTEGVLSRVVVPMRQFRVDMDAVSIRQNQALAAAP